MSRAAVALAEVVTRGKRSSSTRCLTLGMNRIETKHHFKRILVLPTDEQPGNLHELHFLKE